MNRWPLLVTAALGMAACGREPPVPDASGSGKRVAEGTIRQVGSAPSVTTRIETGAGSVVVIGPLALEIARAAGALARVTGSATGDGEADTIRAEAYQLVSVDGMSPLVGVLAVDAGSLILVMDSGRQVDLIGGSARMREATGSKVWVTTRDDGRSIVRWGILIERGY